MKRNLQKKMPNKMQQQAQVTPSDKPKLVQDFLWQPKTH